MQECHMYTHVSHPCFSAPTVGSSFGPNIKIQLRFRAFNIRNEFNINTLNMQPNIFSSKNGIQIWKCNQSCNVKLSKQIRPEFPKWGTLPLSSGLEFVSLGSSCSELKHALLCEGPLSTDVCAALTGRQLEFCLFQSLYFYVNIVARRLEQVPAGNLSEEHATRRVGMCLSSVGSFRLPTLRGCPLFSSQPSEYTFICVLSAFYWLDDSNH